MTVFEAAIEMEYNNKICRINNFSLCMKYSDHIFVWCREDGTEIKDMMSLDGRKKILFAPYLLKGNYVIVEEINNSECE